MLERIVSPAQLRAAQDELDRAGVVPGAIVAWLGHNRWEMLATLAACERIGAVLLPLNWRLSARELASIVGHAGAGHLLAMPETAELGRDLLDLAAPQPGPAQGVQDGDLLLVYTSGTTGKPKGAMHTISGMVANAEAAIDAQGLDASTRALAVLPLFHMGGLCIQTLPTLLAGGQVRIHPRFDAAAWFDDVEQWRPSTSLLVPAVMRALIDHPRWPGADLSSLAFITAGSQIVPLSLIEAFHARAVPVAQVYGATETGPVSIVLRPEEALAHPGMAGRAAQGVEVRLAADGEIQLRAPNLMRTYHRQTEPSFTEGWFCTGDLAQLHPSGCYEVVGRSKDLIISGGENIHPAEIENLLVDVPWVAECAVVGVPDARWGEVAALVIVPQAACSVDIDALHALFAKRLARFKRPQRICVLPELPKTALGKVRRNELVTLVLELPAAPEVIVLAPTPLSSTP